MCDASTSIYCIWRDLGALNAIVFITEKRTPAYWKLNIVSEVFSYTPTLETVPSLDSSILSKKTKKPISFFWYLGKSSLTVESRWMTNPPYVSYQGADMDSPTASTVAPEVEFSGDIVAPFQFWGSISKKFLKLQTLQNHQHHQHPVTSLFFESNIHLNW